MAQLYSLGIIHAYETSHVYYFMGGHFLCCDFDCWLDMPSDTLQARRMELSHHAFASHGGLVIDFYRQSVGWIESWLARPSSRHEKEHEKGQP